MVGLLDKFTIQTDTKEQLKSAIDIVLVWNKRVTHQLIGVDDVGVPFLLLQWYESGGGVALPFPMTSSQSIADYVYLWLDSVGYDKCDEYDGDGCNTKGWIIRNTLKFPVPDYRSTVYDICFIQPAYIYYGK
jgi:hypothetical protein